MGSVLGHRAWTDIGHIKKTCAHNYTHGDTCMHNDPRARREEILKLSDEHVDATRLRFPRRSNRGIAAGQATSTSTSSTPCRRPSC